MLHKCILTWCKYSNIQVKCKYKYDITLLYGINYQCSGMKLYDAALILKLNSNKFEKKNKQRLSLLLRSDAICHIKDISHLAVYINTASLIYEGSDQLVCMCSIVKDSQAPPGLPHSTDSSQAPARQPDNSLHYNQNNMAAFFSKWRRAKRTALNWRPSTAEV